MRLTPFTCGFGLALLSLSVAFYAVTSKCTVVFFDKEATQGQLIRQLAERRATNEQVAQVIHRFNDALNHALARYGRRHHAIILDKKNVLAGGEDITPEIVNELSDVLRYAA
jgi:conjugal transfer pilin signal peptidase TrbI